jgi:hypothetical protein
VRTSILSAGLAVLVAAAPVRAGLAAGAPEPILGAATAEVDRPGSLTPVGDGRFATRGRRYSGRSLARSVVDEWAECFSGRLTTAEQWSLQAPRMIGSHESTVTIRSERAVVTLRLVGRMEYPTASGSWELERATGRCAGLAGEGRYTASFSSSDPELQLRFEGEIRD